MGERRPATWPTGSLDQARRGARRRSLARPARPPPRAGTPPARRHRGEELDTAGDGFFASFDGPGRAIACACAIRDEVGALGLEVRAGLHTGECERVDGKLGGIAVSIGARVAAEAGSGDVLVTGTVRDLVAGSGLELEDRGERELRSVPGRWRLYAVA